MITLLVESPYRHVRLPRGLQHRLESSTSSNIKDPDQAALSPLRIDVPRHLGWTEGFASTSKPLPCRRFIAHQAMGVRIESQFWESPSFGLLQQINQVLLIPVIFACLGLFFPRNYYSGLFHHLYTGLSNGGRINDGRMVVRSVSVHSPANAASGTRTDL